MNGVTILSQETVAKGLSFNILAFILPLIVIFGLFIFITTKAPSYNKKKLIVIGILLALILSTICGFVIGTVFPSAKDSVVEYKVVIDDTTRMKEFYNTYDIVEMEGEIFIVREK